MRQAPERILATCHRNLPATSDTIAKEGYFVPIQTKLHLCAHYEGDALSATGISV